MVKPDTKTVTIHTEVFEPITLDDLFADAVPDRCFAYKRPRSISSLEPHILDIMRSLTLRKGVVLLPFKTSETMTEQATRKCKEVPVELRFAGG